MSNRDHRARSARLIAALAPLIIIASLAGCDSKTDTSKPAPTVQDFCAPFLNYFRTDFPIDTVKPSYLTGKRQADQPVKDAFTCVFNPVTAGNPSLTASVALRPTRADEADGGLTPYLKENNFAPLPGHGKEIWIHDARIKTGPIQTKGVVELTTRIDPWVGSMEIINENDTLAITDEQIGSAAELLIKNIETLSQ
ncbi:hypothetical protein [Nocardia acidivorans]|uniref:hypothetical protein n=1 Tax=Nocardia acidivorans TaxID=404580 RepID=UPI000A5EFB32|nr:hypothetical protein [Nocardia acidivorans]